MELVEIKSKMLVLRNQAVLQDRDVAAIYGVETRAVNQAVKRNLDRFPAGYIFKIDKDECSRSQIVTLATLSIIETYAQVRDMVQDMTRAKKRK